ncbi:TetR/AcrR family transcriptional regulator [Streptomyces sp. NPDC054796]
MKGPRTERSFIEKARRAQIIEAAVEVIAERGYAMASLARIAQHAGISKGVISYHFAGKDELIERLVEQVYGEIGAFIGPRRDGRAEAAARLRMHIESLAEYMRSHRARHIALIEIFGSFRTGDGALYYGVERAEPVYSTLEEIFRDGQRSGEFRDFDVRVMAVSLQSAIDGMFAYWRAHPDVDLTAYAGELADLFAHATRAGGPAGH